ncbi:MAG: phosphatase PAP2 family protein [Deltaproteobacteria bacterium]|nr:phosphatase PAP2 family protein [Deltaproteobacteria bacterium]
MSTFTVEKFKKGLLLLAYFVLGYYGAAHFSFFEPLALPLHPIDKMLPVVPWTVWIYMSEYVLFAALIFLIDTQELMSRVMIGMFVCLTTSIVFFFVFPTVIERTPFIPLDFNGTVLLWLRTWETPRNCFPSLHVGLCYVISFSFLGHSWKKVIFFFIWATLISVSTITTEQHYFLDVPSGFLVAVFSFVFSLLWVPFYLKESPSKNKFFEYDSNQNDKKVFGILARLRG